MSKKITHLQTFNVLLEHCSLSRGQTSNQWKNCAHCCCTFPATFIVWIGGRASFALADHNQNHLHNIDWQKTVAVLWLLEQLFYRRKFASCDIVQSLQLNLCLVLNSEIVCCLNFFPENNFKLIFLIFIRSKALPFLFNRLKNIYEI